MRPGQLLCAGKVAPHLRLLAEERGIRLVDYLEREELAVANAVPTAEGAVQIAMEEMNITLHCARALVIGYGRLGRVTAQRLAALGTHVSVAARSHEQLAWADVWGYQTEHISRLAPWLCSYDLVINTVPASVLGEEELSALKPGVLVIDLASKPGGVDFESAEKLGIKTIWALSLPGKVAPRSAAGYIRNTIYHIIDELGV
jgi:dipicolinate synthase subunit A